MSTFKNMQSHITDLPSYRLFFILAWIASYGLAWYSIWFVEIFYMRAYPIEIFQVNINASWTPNILIGLSFGLTLSLVQTWLIRQRYGFVPLLWRSVTIFGATLAGLCFPLYSYLLGTHQVWISLFVWFSFLQSLQAVVLFRVNRRAWLFALVGIIAGIVAGSISASKPVDIRGYWTLYEDQAFLLASLIQAIGTSIVIMYLMANPREGIVPKRDPDELSKKLSIPLTPLRFIALWTSAYFLAWSIFIIIWFSTGLGFRRSFFGNTYVGWLNYNGFNHSELIVGLMIGLTIGITSAILQTRLIKRFSDIKIQQWALVTIVGWVFAGIAFGYYGQSYGNSNNIISLKNILLLTVWFTAPTFFQTLPIWLAIRHGWLWILTGIGSTIVGIIIDSRFSWWTSHSVNEINELNELNNIFYLPPNFVAHDLSYFYVVVLGGLAYGIITGAVFVLLQSQPRFIDNQIVEA